MPYPSAWSVAVASPSLADPYYGLEAAAYPGGFIPGPTAAGSPAMVPGSPNVSGGHIRELLSPSSSPALVMLVVIIALIVIAGVQFGAGGGIRGAGVGLEGGFEAGARR
jgi:hypothetical protein